MKIPNDPVMLVSFLNLQLRDHFASFEDLCKALDLNQDEVQQKLDTIDYHYKPEYNQFL